MRAKPSWESRAAWDRPSCCPHPGSASQEPGTPTELGQWPARAPCGQGERGCSSGNGPSAGRGSRTPSTLCPPPHPSLLTRGPLTERLLFGAKYTNNYRSSLRASTHGLLMAVRPSSPPATVTVTVTGQMATRWLACLPACLPGPHHAPCCTGYLPIKSAASFPFAQRGQVPGPRQPSREEASPGAGA